LKRRFIPVCGILPGKNGKKKMRRAGRVDQMIDESMRFCHADQKSD
jgi:hypothetical protein